VTKYKVDVKLHYVSIFYNRALISRAQTFIQNASYTPISSRHVEIQQEGKEELDLFHKLHARHEKS
jgi:hypothetical protein